MKLSHRWAWLTCLAVLGFFVMVSSVSYAGVFSDVGLYIKECSNIKAHSKGITTGVKELYRERGSIRLLAQSASSLIQVYRDIKNKSLKSNFPKLIEIAKSIGNLVSSFQKIQPKASAVYQKIKPDLNYFATLKGDAGDFKDKTKKFVIKSFSEERIGKLAGAAGWSRVWDSVKENPFNVFRWGKLSDEYKYGKAEAACPLKCAQIAFESMSYYDAAAESIKGLLGIKSEISKLLGGDLNALLGIGETVNRIEGAAASVETLGDILNQGVSQTEKRFTELIAVQDQYVKIHKEYQQKYNPTGNGTSASSTSGASSATASYTGTSGSSSATSSSTTSNTTAYNGTQDVNNAMEYYQRAYMEYTKIVQNPSSSKSAVDKAISDLQQARQMLDQAKKRASK